MKACCDFVLIDTIRRLLAIVGGLTPVGGLSLVGHLLRAVAAQFDAIDVALSVLSGVSNSDVLRAFLGSGDRDQIVAFEPHAAPTL